MAFVKVADTADIAEGKGTRVVVGGNALMLTRFDGLYYAISDKCTHHGGSLSKGTLADGVIVCPRHGARFDARTGKVVSAQDPTGLKLNVKDIKSYPVTVEGDSIFVDMEP